MGPGKKQLSQQLANASNTGMRKQTNTLMDLANDIDAIQKKPTLAEIEAMKKKRSK